MSLVTKAAAALLVVGSAVWMFSPAPSTPQAVVQPLIETSTPAIVGGRRGARVGDPVPVRSDARSEYQVVEISTKSSGRVKILTRRDGPSGRSFSQRECGCESSTFRYLGDGDSFDAAKNGKPDAKMTRLVVGSISEQVCDFACRYYLPAAATP